MKSIIYKLNDNEFAELVKNSNTYSEVLKELGLSTSGSGSRSVLKRRIFELNININHFTKNGIKKSYSAKYELKEILVENSKYSNIKCLKSRLVKENLLKYECAECKNKGEWNDKKLVLHLDHINGINNDHRIENLRFLCPNCHSQTNTYAGANNKRKIFYCKVCGKEIAKESNLCIKCLGESRKTFEVKNITKEELKLLIKTESFVSIAKMYDTSDTSVKKWCKKYNLPYRKKDIESYSMKDWDIL